MTIEAAIAAGVSEAAWRGAIRRGELEQLHPGVARLIGAPRTAPQWILAGVLACGSGTLASHRAAGHLWDLPVRLDTDVDVIVDRDRRPRVRGVRVHRPRDVGDLTPSRRSGVPCTNALRTLCDIAAVEPDSVADCVEQIVVRGLARPSALRALVARHAGRGRTGIARLRDVVSAWPLGDKPADSVLEVAMARLVDRYGLPPVEHHVWIGGYEVDFRFIGTPVVVECDGWEFHVAEKERWQRDLVRDADLVGLGCIPVRVTYEGLTRRAAATVRRIRAALEQWAPEVMATP